MILKQSIKLLVIIFPVHSTPCWNIHFKMLPDAVISFLKEMEHFEPVLNLRYFSKTTTTGQKNFLGPPGGLLPQKILKMKVLKLAKIELYTALYWKSVYRQ